MDNCRFIQLKDRFGNNYLETLGGIKGVFSSTIQPGYFNCSFKVKNMSKPVKVNSKNTQMVETGHPSDYINEFTIPDALHTFTLWPLNFSENTDCFVNVETEYILDSINMSCPIRLLHKRTLQQLVDYCGGTPVSLIFGYTTDNRYVMLNDVCNKGVTGDLSVFSNVTTLNELNLYQENVTGDIVSLGKSTSLTKLYLFGTQCHGTIESLAEAQIANGRTSGTLELNGNGIITYDGVAIPAGYANKKTITFSNGSYTVA